MPLLPPVTIATLPCRLMPVLLRCGGLGGSARAGGWRQPMPAAEDEVRPALVEQDERAARRAATTVMTLQRVARPTRCRSTVRVFAALGAGHHARSGTGRRTAQRPSAPIAAAVAVNGQALARSARWPATAARCGQHARPRAVPASSPTVRTRRRARRRSRDEQDQRPTQTPRARDAVRTRRAPRRRPQREEGRPVEQAQARAASRRAAARTA